MKHLVLCSCILFALSFLADSAPIFDDDDFDFAIPDITVDCTRMGCAEGINRCSKETKTSKDTKTLTHTVKCFNSAGTEDGEPIVTHSANPNPGSIQNGYVYYGSYSNSNINHNINHGTSHNTQHTENVETFDK